MHLRKRLLAISIAFLIATPILAADVEYPYLRIRLKLPPSEDPFPGMGNYYSTLSKGMKSALWNPASLGKLKLSEASLSLISPPEAYNYQRDFPVNEASGTMEGGIDYGIFFRYPQDIGTGINTKEVTITAHANYATSSTGMNFTSALKVNDWLMLGFASNSPLEVDTSLSGDFPLTARAAVNLYGESLSKMQIGATDGKLKYTFTSGDNVSTYESTQALWGGFLSQEATIPLTSLTEFRNSMNIQSPYLGTLASKLGNLSLGINMIPISATANIDNDFRSVINADTEDVFLYVPDFDAEDQTELANWINDPDKYGTSAGYKRKQIKLPAGEIIGTGKYRGFYAASTARFDVGAMYDLTDWLTIGFSLENASGSSLNFKGNGIASYFNYRNVNTAEAGSLTDLISPGGQTSLDLIKDTWVTTTEVGDYKLYLEPEKKYDLPKRTRYGIALKKPFLIAIDFEQNQNPIKVAFTQDNQAREITISNINFMRVGVETKFLFFPLWLRGGLTLISKPSVAGLTADEQTSLDSAFSYGIFPLKLDLGSEMDTWGIISGTTFGINAQSIFSILQFDTTHIDLSKMTYYNMYVGKDAWQISYLAQFDAFASAGAYNNREDKSKKLEQPADYLPFLKFVQTVGVTYRF